MTSETDRWSEHWLDLRFIVTGHRRSGTQWLAQVLNQCNPGVAVRHEPLVQYDARHYAGVGDAPLDWDEEQGAAFWRLAGDVQRFFGYEGG